jgi:hypothetical protein
MIGATPITIRRDQFKNMSVSVIGALVGLHSLDPACGHYFL